MRSKDGRGAAVDRVIGATAGGDLVRRRWGRPSLGAKRRSAPGRERSGRPVCRAVRDGVNATGTRAAGGGSLIS